MSGERGKSTNTFKQGLNTDMHPLDTPNSVMTENSNATLITSEGDEFILQNMRGNHLKTALTPGFRPVARQVFNNIAYIISRNIDDPTIGEIGTFPSPDWATLNEAIPVITTKLLYTNPTVVQTFPFPELLPITLNQASLTSSRKFTGTMKVGSEVPGFPYTVATICDWRITWSNGHSISVQPGQSYSYTTTDVTFISTVEYLKPHALDNYACNGPNTTWVDYRSGINNESQEFINVVRYDILMEGLDLFNQPIPCDIDFTGTGIEGTIVAAGVPIVGSGGNITNWVDVNGTTIDSSTGVIEFIPLRNTFNNPYFEVHNLVTTAITDPTLTAGSDGVSHAEVRLDFDITPLGLTALQLLTATLNLRHADNYGGTITYGQLNTVIPGQGYKVEGTGVGPIAYTLSVPSLAQEGSITLTNLNSTSIFTLVLDYQARPLNGMENAFDLYITYEDVQGEILAPMLDMYAPLHNFFDYAAIPIPTEEQLDDESNYTAPLRTASFNFKDINFVDIELQPSYDRSVNIIFTDDKNKPKIVNSRFIVKEGNKEATLANRQGNRDTNIYSDDRWGNSELITTPATIARLDFKGLLDGGNMLPGGYRFYFVYANSDLQQTNVFSESRLVQVHRGSGDLVSGGKPDERVAKTVHFRLSNLDTKFLYVKVLYARDMGEFTAGSFGLNEIFNLYPIPTEGELDIRVTGFELTKTLSQEYLNTQFSDLSTVQTLTAIQGSLALANIGVSIEHIDYLRAKCAAILITTEESWGGEIDPEYAGKTTRQKRSPYMDASNTYYRLGYWTGETYEFGIVFKMAETNLLSPVIPLRGHDNFDGTATYSAVPHTVIDAPGFDDSTNDRENTNGVYRINEKKTVRDGDGPYPDSPKITHIEINVDSLLNDSYLQEITQGYFIVRKKRTKDCQYEGYLSHTTAVRLDDPIGAEETFMMTGERGGLGSLNDLGDESNVGTPTEGDYYCAATAADGSKKLRKNTPAKYLPTPGNLLNNTEPTDTSTTAKPQYWKYIDFTNKPATHTVVSHLSYYTPEIVTRPADVAAFFGGTQRGMRFSENSTYINRGDEVGFTSTEKPSFFWGTFKLQSGREGALSTNAMTTYNLNTLKWNYVTAGQDTITPESFVGIVRGIQTRVRSTVDFTNDYGYVVTNAASGVGPNDRGRIYHKFDDFVGLQIDSGDSGALFDRLNHVATNSGNILQNAPTGALNTFLDQSDWIGILDTNRVVMGVLTRTYASPLGPITQGINWQAANQSTTVSGYFAITDRYDWDRANTEFASAPMKVYDGDCYIGELYKRINYKLGIESDIAATNPNLYEEEASALADAGMVFGMVLSSSDNFSLRSEEFKSASEKLVYGTDRRFFPLYSLADIRTIKQLDSKLHYNGFELELAALPYNRQSVELPAVVSSFPYRIMISAPADLSSFTNGYRDFSGLNFRDYDSAFGQIVKIITLHSQLYCIWEFGIGMIQTSEKTMVSQEDGGVYVNQASRLHPQSQVLSNKYGSTDPYSIITSADSVYGIDWTNNKVWQIKAGQFAIISDFKIERILLEYKTFFNNNNTVPKFYGGYDSYKRNVFFNYSGLNQGDHAPVGSIYYSELMNIWVSKLTFYPYFIFNLRENWYSFDFSEQDASIAGQIWEHDSDEAPFCNFYGKQHPFEYEFILVDNPSVQKILNNLKIISTEEYPIYATYTIIDKHNYETNAVHETSFVDRLIKRYKQVTATMLPVVVGSPYLLFSEDPGLLAGEHIVVNDGTKYEVQDVILYLGEYYAYVMYIDPLTTQATYTVSQAYTGEETVVINNGIIKENILYKEDHFYIVVGNKFIAATNTGLLGTQPASLPSTSELELPESTASSTAADRANILNFRAFNGINPLGIVSGQGLLITGDYFSNLSDTGARAEVPPNSAGLTPNTPIRITNQMQLGAPRDKYIRIKLRYRGDKQVFIQAVESMFTYSFS